MDLGTRHINEEWRFSQRGAVAAPVLRRAVKVEADAGPLVIAQLVEEQFILN